MFFRKKFEDNINNRLYEISNSIKKISELKMPSTEKETINSDIDIMIGRFYKIFELHGINKIEIPQVIDSQFNLSILDISSNENLLKIINIDILEWVSNYFGIQLNWLLNKTDNMYEIQNFDKFYMSLFRMINSLSMDKKFSISIFKNCNLKKNNSNEQKQKVYPIISIELMTLNNRIICKYIPINDYIWDYERSRIDFKLIIYLLYYKHIGYYKDSIYSYGYDLNEDISYYDFIKGIFNFDKLKRVHQITWYPTDYIENKDSTVSLESDDLDTVIRRIERENLILLIKEHLNFWDKQDLGENFHIESKIQQRTIENEIIIYTEGKSDYLHIENAWKILYNKPHKFKFVSLDGAAKLFNFIKNKSIELENHISSNGFIMAILDSDKTGIDNFKKLAAKQYDIEQYYMKYKSLKNTYILLLPEPSNDLKGCCEIEFLYPRKVLEKYEILEYRDTNNMLHNNIKFDSNILSKIENKEYLESLKFYKITENEKMKFAENIQKDETITKKDLEGFVKLFELINKIVKIL
ncbi:hypothetical protein [Aliarcobacter butzleri]|uniref:hypothetical protein n=1 Tax=Aliarcobacter butzleri TaxID=28197 RepID=UPI001EDF4C64|nr:hypothetical protein [Aliarcobacter butzleri]MCG3681994.1 hypothetical protein [Aliarcobacter butzleri]